MQRGQEALRHQRPWRVFSNLVRLALARDLVGALPGQPYATGCFCRRDTAVEHLAYVPMSIAMRGGVMANLHGTVTSGTEFELRLSFDEHDLTAQRNIPADMPRTGIYALSPVLRPPPPETTVHRWVRGLI